MLKNLKQLLFVEFLITVAVMVVLAITATFSPLQIWHDQVVFTLIAGVAIMLVTVWLAKVGNNH